MNISFENYASVFAGEQRSRERKDIFEVPL